MGVGEDQTARPSGGKDRRLQLRHAVDCRMLVASLKGSFEMTGRLVELSEGGCRMITDQPFLAGILVRVEVQFQVRGIALRLNGVTQGGRSGKSFAIRFTDVSQRKLAELAEVLDELAIEDRKRVSAPAPTAPAPAPPNR